MYGYIYLIINKVNGKTYIGQHKSNKYWYEDKYMGTGKNLFCAYNKYGKENFEKYLIQYAQNKDELDKAEIFWIAEYRNRGKAEYNICIGGQGFSYGTKRGKMSDAHKKKISEAKKGKAFSENHKKKIADAHKNVPRDAETKKKISESHKGKHLSEETKQKLSNAHKGMIPWNKGKHFRITNNTGVNQ